MPGQFFLSDIAVKCFKQCTCARCIWAFLPMTQRPAGRGLKVLGDEITDWLGVRPGWVS
jgi:hypothetical protein